MKHSETQFPPVAGRPQCREPQGPSLEAQQYLLRRGAELGMEVSVTLPQEPECGEEVERSALSPSGA